MDETPPPTLKKPPPSLISADLLVTGTLHSEGEIHIDGIVTGEIRTDVLIIGRSASVNGEIFADSLRIHGRVAGQITARSVSLGKSAYVRGDILHEKLVVEQGANLQGLFHRIGNHISKTDNSFKLLLNGMKNPSPPPKSPY